MSYYYLAYGLVLQLPFVCPLVPNAPDGAKPDVTVTEGKVPKWLVSPIAEDKYWQIEPNKFLLRGGRKAGRFLVEDGAQITLERNPEADDVRLAIYFFATVLAVLLQQRGLLVLHANTALTPLGAVTVSGVSGAGKTTTVAGLLNKECQLLADDITVLRLNDTSLVEVVPGPPQLHLCEDTAEIFGYDIQNIPRFAWRRMKAAVSVPHIMAAQPAPLSALYQLVADDVDDVRIDKLSGFDKFAVLQDCLYGPTLPNEHPDQFALFSVMLDSIPFYRISRPASRWSLDEVIEVILQHG
ncbi:MAG: hypothetical protein CXR30_13570 [Geobacter sp.]|nr:MAG: hypothetical protein CXR30_13570 [Geobacter sp.]